MSRLRCALIADIHGNAVAFDAVLRDMNEAGFDAAICLGDAVQGGPQPVEVVARLRELKWPVIMGNADAWLVTGEETGKETLSESLRDIREWSLAQLSDADREFISAFVPTASVALPGDRTLLAFHGSPQSFDDFIFPHTAQETVEAMLDGHDAAFYAGGHTHVQQLRHLGKRTYFNPGSVGLAYRHGQTEGAFCADPWAEYAILTVSQDRWSLDLRRVPFDVEALRRAYKQTARPHIDRSLSMYREGP